MQSFLDGLGGVLLPIWLPIVAAPIVYMMRRYAFAAALFAAVVMGATAWWLVRFPPAGDWLIVGRRLVLSGLAQMLLVALALWLLVAFLYAWRISQGWTAFPFLLVVYGFIAAALFFEELILQVLLLKLAWLIVILLVQGGAAANTRAATRLLILSVLALPPFLIAATLISQQLYQPDAPLQVPLIVFALAMGFRPDAGRDPLPRLAAAGGGRWTAADCRLARCRDGQ